MGAEREVVVSVVMPVRNEERYIGGCLRSLLGQDYPRERMEWIVVDGRSTDRTREIAEGFSEGHPGLVRVLDNPDRTVPFAMNIGIGAASGRYVVRLDAHASYARDYISKCVEVLERTGADNVGGVARTEGRGRVGGAIAKMLSSKFGVGNSQFRTAGSDGWVDTVPFGAFRREVFERLGGYDTRLTRNQDNEMNWRIRRGGGGIYLSNEIRLTYYCRDTVGGIASMAAKNGMWNVVTMYLCPGSMGARHFVPLAFLLSLVLLPLAGLLWQPFWTVLAAELCLYFALDAVFSLRSASGVREALLLFVLFPAFHLSYGAGSVAGLAKLATGRYRRAARGTSPEKINPTCAERRIDVSV